MIWKSATDRAVGIQRSESSGGIGDIVIPLVLFQGWSNSLERLLRSSAPGEFFENEKYILSNADSLYSVVPGDPFRGRMERIYQRR